MNVPYIPGQGPPPELPLGRFLPPIPAGMVRKWSRENLAPGTWVLDPFGFNPLVPIELAASGHPVLVTANNPIHAFLIQILASAPQREDFLTALQDLAVASKRDDRMEPYIRRLYQIQCADCRNLIEAEAFLWKRDAQEPYGVLVNCPQCGALGEQEITETTRNSMTPLPAAGLHRARALVRIADQDDPLRSQVEQAVNCYPIRALIVLQTIINKLDSLEQSPHRRELLTALILTAADFGNTLWTHPTPRSRPRQLVVPPVYRERNLWKALEAGAGIWPLLNSPIPVHNWTDRHQETEGIFLFEGRLKALEPKPEPGFFSAVLTALPRPNQAFWTLSALWSGWLWGRDAVTPIRQVLTRQRYDWNWHTNALRAILSTLYQMAASTLTFWGMVAENEPMLLLSTLLSADSVGFQLQEFALSLDDDLAQCRWRLRTVPGEAATPARCLRVARETIRHYFTKKGEPAPYQLVHAAVVATLARKNLLAMDSFLENENLFTSETQRLLDALFKERGLLERVGGGTASLDTGIWWLQKPPKNYIPLMDQVEKRVVQYLIKQNTATSESLAYDIYQALPGLFTPENALILNCLDSYAHLEDPEEHRWKLNKTEHPAARKADLQEMQGLLQDIAKVVSYEASGDSPLLWKEPGADQPDYVFHLIASSIVQPHLGKKPHPAANHIVLLPGSRANLLAFKQQRDPILRKKLDALIVVKFRLIRDLAVNPLLSRKLFQEQIHSDPPEYHASQLALF